ncbi:uncharacterized protein LOC110454866 [Mizuhopecten yessoensis]|uniref:Protein ovo n=1 Tax=Mizuhopecten yessoensis TaxID=6573 RepID=A0A210QEA8_MIZYE|nr:uncharacterized protein LOC110454866 [Mizuhopecten yessoensis]OWF47064.1 Protein ovo [Mizuhopecten yessoensis]
MPRTFLVRRAGEENNSLCQNTENEELLRDNDKENIGDICTDEKTKIAPQTTGISFDIGSYISQNAHVTSCTSVNTTSSVSLQTCAPDRQCRVVVSNKGEGSCIKNVRGVDVNDEESSSSSFSSSQPDDSLLSSISDTSDLCQDIDFCTSADESVLKSPEPPSSSGLASPQQTLPPFASLALGVCLSSMQANSNSTSNMSDSVKTENDFGVKLLPQMPLYSPAMATNRYTDKLACTSMRNTTSVPVIPFTNSSPASRSTPSKGSTRQPLGQAQSFSTSNNILSPLVSEPNKQNCSARQSPRSVINYLPSNNTKQQSTRRNNSPKKTLGKDNRISHSINTLVSSVQHTPQRNASPRKPLGLVHHNSNINSRHVSSFPDALQVNANPSPTLRLPLILPLEKENADNTTVTQNRKNFQPVADGAPQVKLPVKLQMKQSEHRYHVFADSLSDKDESKGSKISQRNEVKHTKDNSYEKQVTANPKPKIWNPLHHVFDAKKFSTPVPVQDMVNSSPLTSHSAVFSPQVRCRATQNTVTRCASPVEVREIPAPKTLMHITSSGFPSMISPSVTSSSLRSRPHTPSLLETARSCAPRSSPVLNGALAHQRQQYLVQNYPQVSPGPQRESTVSPALATVPLLHTSLQHPVVLEMRQSPIPEVFRDNFDLQKQPHMPVFKQSFPAQHRVNMAETKTIFSTSPFAYQKIDSQTQFSTMPVKRPPTPLFGTGKRFKSEQGQATQNLPFNPLQQLASVCVDQGKTWGDNPSNDSSGHVPIFPATGNSRHLEMVPSDSNSSESKTDENEEPDLDFADSSFLKMLQGRHGLQNIEFVNGGNGIKNPSFVAPKPADITNTHQDIPTVLNGSCCCKVCGKEFKLQRLLNRHLKCHSDVKRFLCTFCGKGFNDTFDLKRHTRIHTGVKPYKCLRCDKSFTQRCSLESHCRKVHNTEYDYEYKQRRNKMYVCEECGFSTDEAETYYIHLRQNHPNCPVLAKPHDKRHFKFRNERLNLATRTRSDSELKPEVKSEGKLHVDRFLSMR